MTKLETSGKIGKREIKESIKVASIVFLSRITGFLRELVVAYLFGTSWIASSLVVATRLPNMFRRLLGEGTLSSVFVSLYSRERVKNEKRAREFASRAYSSVMTLAWSLSILAVLLAPLLVRLITFDFASSGRRIFLSISLSRVTLPYIGISTGVAFLAGLLNSHGYFYQPMFSQVILNFAMIVFALVAVVASFPLRWAAFLVVAGFLVGGIAQLAYQRSLVKKKVERSSPFLKYRVGFDYRDPLVRELLLKTLPGVIGLAAYEANVVIDTLLAWHYSESAVSALYYANRIYLLPVGVIGASYYTVILPLFARNAEMKKSQELSRNVYFSLLTLLFLTMPLVWLTIFNSKDVVAVVFMRGNFSLLSVHQTSSALNMLSFAIPFAVSLKVLVSLFYSHKDTVTPMKGSVLAMVSNSVLDFTFIKPMGYTGLALASALSVLINFSYLFLMALKKNLVYSSKLLSFGFKSLIVSLFSFVSFVLFHGAFGVLSEKMNLAFPKWNYLLVFTVFLALFYVLYLALGYFLFFRSRFTEET